MKPLCGHYVDGKIISCYCGQVNLFVDFWMKDFLMKQFTKPVANEEAKLLFTAVNSIPPKISIIATLCNQHGKPTFM